MVDFILTFSFVDSVNGETTRSFSGDFLDAATAKTAAEEFYTDYDAIIDCAITQYTLTEVVPKAGTPDAGSLVFNTASVTVNKSGGGKANVNIAGQPNAILSVNSLNTGAAGWTAWFANISTAGAAGWTISDGETADSVVSGKRVIRGSGSTNLPS